MTGGPPVSYQDGGDPCIHIGEEGKRMDPREYLAEAGKVLDEHRTSRTEAPDPELERVVTLLRSLEEQGQGDLLDDPAELDTTLEGLLDRIRTQGGSEPVFQEMYDVVVWTRDELGNQTRLNRYE